MGSSSIPPAQPLPPPAPSFTDENIVAARRREQQRRRARAGRSATILTGPRGSAGTVSIGIPRLLGTGSVASTGGKPGASAPTGV
jgi:hypothetical protein